MPMPLWWGQINKRLFNPKALQNGKWKIINHVGRSSGRAYRTPLDAYEVDGTYVFILVYGPKSDWVRNVVASGQASLEVDDEIVELVSPRIVPGHTAWPMLEGVAKRPPGFLGIDEFLLMDIASRVSVHADQIGEPDRR